MVQLSMLKRTLVKRMLFIIIIPKLHIALCLDCGNRKEEANPKAISNGRQRD